MTQRQPITHGTPSGATLHRRRKERICQPCAAAELEYFQQRKRARQEQALRRPPTGPPGPERLWSEDRACKGTPVQEWVPDAGEEVTDWHRHYCDTCPVRQVCLQWATDTDQWGVWAATTRDERRALKRRKQRRESAAKTRQQQREAS